MGNEAIDIPSLTKLLQSEYDRHMAKYLKGCIGCINAAIAIRDLARLLEIHLVENDRTKTLPPNAAR